MFYLYYMKRFFVFFWMVFYGCLCYAGSGANTDTVKKSDAKRVFLSVTIEPRYPGGMAAFNRYVTRNLHYPDAAKLMCINGKVYVSFSIDTIGRVTDVSAINCLGAGCEAEAVKVVQRSKPWKPAIKNGRPVKVQYIIPINFTMETNRIYMENLIASGYGFVFKINGKLYPADDAERIIGKSFNPEKIEIAEPYNPAFNDPKLVRHRKKETYLISIKSS